MNRLTLPLFFARRMRSGRRGVMTLVATLTVAVGMAVMVVALAVITGFRREITGNLRGLAADIQLVSLDNANALETTPVVRDAALERQIGQLATIGPFAVKGGIVRTDAAMQGVVLKGVGAGYDWEFFERHLVEGVVPRTAGSVRSKDILISTALADLLELQTDDRVEMLFVREGQAPRRDRFRISGLYSTGFEELDRMIVPTDLRNVQRLNHWDEDQVSGYEVMAAGMEQVAPLREDIQAILDASPEGPRLAVADLQSRYPGLMDWLRAHNVNAAVIITIMLLVALLNMVSALLIILLECTRTIGTLKALGMRNGAVQRIFLARSAGIVLRGMLWGNLVGLAVCAVQGLWHPLKLDRAGYFLTEVPVALGWEWWLTLNAGSFAVLLLLMVLPTMIVSLMKPDTTLRFK